MLYVHTIGRIGKDCQVITGTHGSLNCQIQLSITADTLEFINTGKREETTSEAGSPTDATSDVPVPPVAMPQENKEDLPF